MQIVFWIVVNIAIGAFAVITCSKVDHFKPTLTRQADVAHQHNVLLERIVRHTDRDVRAKTCKQRQSLLETIHKKELSVSLVSAAQNKLTCLVGIEETLNALQVSHLKNVERKVIQPQPPHSLHRILLIRNFNHLISFLMWLDNKLLHNLHILQYSSCKRYL